MLKWINKTTYYPAKQLARKQEKTRHQATVFIFNLSCNNFKYQEHF